MISSRMLSTVIACAVVLTAGCSQRIGDFTLISTKNVEIGGKYKKLPDRFKGEDKKDMVLAIPLGIPDLKTAVDNCIEAGGGELLSNAVLESSFWTVVVWGEQKYTVTGDVWVKGESSDLTNPQIELYELQRSPLGYELVSTTDPAQTVKVDYLLSSR